MSGESRWSRRPPIAIAIVLGVLIATTVIPALIAWHDDVFREDGMLAHLPPQAAAEHKRNDEMRAIDRALLERTEDALRDAARGPSTAVVDALLARQATLEKRLQEPPRVVANAFAINRINLLWWPLFYLLGLLMASTAPRTGGRPAIAKVLGIGLLIYATIAVWQWIRNFGMGEAGQHIYSFVNASVSASSFLYQEVEVLGLAMLIALTWLRWWAHDADRSGGVAKRGEPTAQALELLISELAREVADEISRWQLASIAIAALFGAEAAFYAGNIVYWHDGRYLPSVIVFESIGLLTWAFATRPLVAARRRWLAARRDVLARLASDTAQVESRLRILDAAEPASLWSSVIATAVGAFAFAWPLVAAIWKH